MNASFIGTFMCFFCWLRPVLFLVAAAGAQSLVADFRQGDSPPAAFPGPLPADSLADLPFDSPVDWGDAPSVDFSAPLPDSRGGVDGVMAGAPLLSAVTAISEIFASDGSRSSVTNAAAKLDLATVTALHPGETAVVPPAVVERGPGYRVIESVSKAPGKNGTDIYRTNRVTVRGDLKGEESPPGVRSSVIRPPSVVEVGDHFKKVESVTEFLDSDGAMILRTNSFVEFDSEDVHTKLHQDLNLWLQNYRSKAGVTMNLMPRKGVPGTKITSTYGFSTVEQAMREFYQAKYPRYLPLFEEEARAIKAGLTYVP